MNEIKKSKCDMCKDAGITCAHWPGGCAGDDIVDSIGTYELARLRAERDRLREALVQITKRDDWTSGECRHHARAALGREGESDGH